jgi:hypothetical protein
MPCSNNASNMPPRPAPSPVSKVTVATAAIGPCSRRTGFEVMDLTDMTRRRRAKKKDGNDLMPRRNMNQIDFSALLMRAAHR